MSLPGGYDFSQLYHASLLAFSPGSTFLATIHTNRLIIRSTSTLAIVRTFQCLPSMTIASSSRDASHSNIDTLLWSADSLYILAFSSKLATAWIFGLTDDGNGDGGEVARIGGEGVEGLVRVEWGRGGREVLAWSDYGLRLTIYDLATGSAKCIQHPKWHLNCHTYSPDSRYLAVAERHASKDYIGIYDTYAGYALLRHFPLTTSDVQGILWSPCGRYIAAYDGIITYGLYIHSPLGPLLASLTPSSPSFSPLSSTEDPGLGIRCAVWAPGGRWIALGGWDNKVRIAESEGGRCIAVLGWSGKTVEKDTTIWREPGDWLKETRGHGIVQFNRHSSPASLPTIRTDLTRTPPVSGISHLSFDAEATLLLVRLETQPNVIHIHTFLPNPTSPSPEINHLAALVFSEPVRTTRWCPGKRRIAVSTRGAGVYFWDGDEGWIEEVNELESEEPRGGVLEGVGIPTRTDFVATETAWAPDGTSLAILDRTNSQFCVLYDDQPEEAEHSVGESRRWDVNEGLTHVSEEFEEEGHSLGSLQEAEQLWRESLGSRSGLVA